MGRITTKVILQPIKFRKKDHVVVLCPNNPDIDEVIRDLDGAEWSTGYRFWHLPLSKSVISTITKDLKGIAKVDSSAFKSFDFGENIEKRTKRKKQRLAPPSKEQQTKLQDFKDSFLNNGYSESTIKVYMSMLNVFFGWFNDKKDTEITNQDIKSFLNEYIENNNMSENYKRLITNAIRRYYDYIAESKKHKLEIKENVVNHLIMD